MQATAALSTATDLDRHTLALGLAQGVGRLSIQRLLQHFDTAEEVLKASTAQLQRVAGIGEKLAATIHDPQLLAAADTLLQASEEGRVRILDFNDPDYPERLRHTHGAPFMLFGKGNFSLNHPRVLSIVGTRTATRQAQSVIKKLLTQLAQSDVLIVSGLAYGVDSWAHQAAVNAGLPTVAILPSGVENIYPTAHLPLVRDMLATGGGVVSEYGLEGAPDKPHFPARNRIIAGVADATIVIEAPKRSGALITAQFANSYDREVFAVPGSWATPQAQGCNQLIKNHQAHILTCPEDIVELLEWEATTTAAPAASTQQQVLPADLTPEERTVMEVLQQREEPVHIDLLRSLTQLSTFELNTSVLQLELRGCLQSIPGKGIMSCC